MMMECAGGETRGDDEGEGCLVAAEVEEWRGWLGFDRSQRVGENTGCELTFFWWADMSLGLGVFNGPDHGVGLGFGFGLG